MKFFYKIVWFVWSYICDVSGQKDGTILYAAEMWLEDSVLGRMHPEFTEREKDNILSGAHWI